MVNQIARLYVSPNGILASQKSSGLYRLTGTVIAPSVEIGVPRRSDAR
jgi:hypothetical protein